MNWFSPVSQVQLILIVAVLVGGGGVAYGIANLVVQLLALFLLALNAERVATFFREAPRFLTVLVLASLALPLFQIVPLPPTVWTQMPGRDLVEQSLTIIGEGDNWFPISVDRNRTLVAFFSLLPVLAILAIGWKLDDRETRRLVWTFVACAVAVVLLGGFQLASGNSIALFFPETVNRSNLYGTFANRNTTGIFLDLGLVALIGLRSHGREWWDWGVARIAIGALLLVALVLTRSRSSMTILLVVLAFAAWRHLEPAWLARRLRTRTWIVAVVAFIAVVSGVLVATPATRLAASFERFSNLEDERPHVWEDTIEAARRYWPVGSGTATFDEVFQVDESLEYLSSRRAGRAHNDYLELTLESGIAGIFVLGGWFWLIARGTLLAFGRKIEWSVMSGGLGLACLASQSLVDYPLRNQTILCCSALFLLLLLGPARDDAAGAR